MKKSVKILAIISVVFIIFTFNISNASYNKMAKSNSEGEENASEYKIREINILGLKITFGDKIYFDGNNDKITDEEKQKSNIIIGACGIVFIVYWLILLFTYEKEDVYDYTYENSDDIETLRKYNPMLAGCLVDNRQVLCRDVTAVVLNLIQKQVLNMKMIPTLDGEDNYTYIISENKKTNAKLDEIERYVLSWIFGFYEQEEVDLISKLKELSKRKDFIKHMKQLNVIAQNELNKIGANIPKVPLFLRKINVFLVIFSIIMATIHIITNGLNVHIYQTTIFLFLIIVAAVILILPIVALAIHIILFTIVLLKKVIKTTVEGKSGKKIITTSIFILLLMFVFILVAYFVLPEKYVILDVFMIGMSLLIVKTDNLMTKHDKEILNDYYSLQEIKCKIENYSLIKDKQINYIRLWEEYLVYAVAFGISIPIVDKLNETYKEDEDIQYLLKCESLYYICKAYLEVMWEMEFKEKKDKFNLKELFEVSPTISAEQRKYY